MENRENLQLPMNIAPKNLEAWTLFGAVRAAYLPKNLKVWTIFGAGLVFPSAQEPGSLEAWKSNSLEAMKQLEAVLVCSLSAPKALSSPLL